MLLLTLTGVIVLQLDQKIEVGDWITFLCQNHSLQMCMTRTLYLMWVVVITVLLDSFSKRKRHPSCTFSGFRVSLYHVSQAGSLVESILNVINFFRGNIFLR